MIRYKTNEMSVTEITSSMRKFPQFAYNPELYKALAEKDGWEQWANTAIYELPKWKCPKEKWTFKGLRYKYIYAYLP